MARPRGAKNKITRRRERKIQAHADIIRAMIGEQNYFDGDAHAFLMYVYKDRRRDPELRLEAAKAAISYEKPKLAAINVKGDVDGKPLQQNITLQFVDPPVWNEPAHKIIDHKPTKTLESQIKFV